MQPSIFFSGITEHNDTKVKASSTFVIYDYINYLFIIFLI